MKTYENASKSKFATRINQVPRSFIRDILAAAVSPNVISFAGGLPNKKYFPTAALAESTARVFKNKSTSALQYSITQGLPELRELIAQFYKNQGLNININNIMITTGSQQALDLIGKVFINNNDTVVLEEPSYLGAIQAFSMYQPNFVSVKLESDGIETEKWANIIQHSNPKLSYVIPNFQNPTGLSYSTIKRKVMAEMAINYNSLIIEDDPYAMIRFSGKALPNIYSYAPENTILLGSFSKIVAPGFRLGWIIGASHFIEKLELAKQATDLHSDVFSQYILIDYLKNNDISKHINTITSNYKLQAETLCMSLADNLSSEFKFTIPQGGMFSWLTMPKGISSMEVFKIAKEKDVIFVPGIPFYANTPQENTLRLNFSCTEPDVIKQGIKRLSEAIFEVIEKTNKNPILA